MADPGQPDVATQLCLTICWYTALKHNGVHAFGQFAALPATQLMVLRHSLRAVLLVRLPELRASLAGRGCYV